MASTTRGASARALQYLLSDILEVDEKGPVSLALAMAEITKITQLLQHTEAELCALTFYPTGKEVLSTLLISHARELYHGIEYYKFFTSTSAATEWFALDSSTFAAWLANPEPPTNDIFLDTDANAPVVTVRTPTTDVANFNKQVRRTPGDFKPFKKDSEWSNWNRALLATANAQGVQSSYDIQFHSL